MSNEAPKSMRQFGVCSFCNKTEDDVEKLIVANVCWRKIKTYQTILKQFLMS